MSEISVIGGCAVQPMTTKKRKKAHPVPLVNHVCEHLTTVAHVCIGAATIYLVWLSSTSFEFFNWHPMLLSIGWLLLMTEALLMLTKDNVFSGRATHRWRVRCHWTMQIAAVAMSVAGFVVAFLYEDVHFETSHGVYGLIALILGVIPTCASGVPALFSLRLRGFIHPKLNKFLHAGVGMTSVLFGGVAMILSLYTGWFAWKTNGDPVIFALCFVAICFGIAWALVRPLLTAVERMRGFMHL